MKRVVSNDELQEKTIEGIKLLCGTVKTTLGPKGSNVIIDHSTFSPFITNDGVTIAENIESEDPVINTILELTKEASIKTNETVGDGTTTTLVLLESIFLEGRKLIQEGYNQVILKRELDEQTLKIIEEIKKESKVATLKELSSIVNVSANDSTIGELLIEAYKKVGANAIKIKEHDKEETIVNYLKGYYFDTLIASPYFFKDEKINLDNSKILITNKEIKDIEDISSIINYIFKTNESLIIIAKDYSDYFVNEIVNLYYENNLKIILLKSPGYGEEELDILSDIAIISNTNIVYNLEDININILGQIESILIEKDKTKISFKTNERVEERIKELERKKDKNKNVENRLAMFKSGTVEILVGAVTTTERREKKMRYDDALCALNCANKGIVPGSGIILLKLSENLKANGIEKILKIALTKPIKQILENAGLEQDKILKIIKENNYDILYNVKNDTYENIFNTEVLDTTEVIINSLKNASSIAGMLLTTTTLIINEYQNNLNNLNNYNEL